MDEHQQAHHHQQQQPHAQHKPPTQGLIGSGVAPCPSTAAAPPPPPAPAQPPTVSQSPTTPHSIPTSVPMDEVREDGGQPTLPSDDLRNSHPAPDRTLQPKSGSGNRLLRRAFTLPRNPFLRLSSRKFLKVNGASVEHQGHHQQGTYVRTNGTIESPLITQNGGTLRRTDESDEHSNHADRRSRSSWKKIIVRLAHQMTNVGMKSSHSLNGDRVPPLSGYLDAWPPDQIPGVTGLKNHGNTCFMNAVLQCLSHTDILAEYFVLDQYKADLKRRNKMTSRKFGTKGELTEQLALVLKALWTCKFETDFGTTVGFKAVVDRYGTQFRSSTQHDAQEFLFWLLDKVHEDLNTAPKRKYKSIKNTFGRPDEVIAAETLANHVRGNRSFVQAVFQAQFRSSLACPQCHQQSNTFDPFHCISVQLPQNLAQLPVFVTVRYAAQHPRQVKIGIGVPFGSPVSSLRAQLHTDTGIPVDCMVLVEISDDTGFGRVLADSYPLGALGQSVYCIETPPPPKNDVDGLLTLLIVNAKLADGKMQRFGTPFSVQIRRDVTHKDLQKRLLKEMQTVLKPEVFAYAVQPTDMFKMRLQDPSADNDAYMETKVEHPLFMEMIDLALVVLCADAGPPHVKLLLEWTEPERFFSDMSDDYVEHESVTQFQNKSEDDTSLTLEQCLEHYTRAETLSNDDAWRCPHCQKYLPVVKTLGLWSLPDILVIHFKRFSSQSSAAPGQFGRSAAKLTTAVTFPLTDFDMTPHLAQQPADTNHATDTLKKKTSRRTPLNANNGEGLSGGEGPEQQDNRYDLYAVCYHQGDTLETGHYTAACKNPYDHQWYRFDDQKVTAVPVDRTIEDIVNNEAYILFYQRRCPSREPEASRSNSTANVSLSGLSSMGGLSEHWVSKIAPVPPSPISSSVSQGSIGMDSLKTLESPIRSDDKEMESPVGVAQTPKQMSDADICGISDMLSIETNTDMVDIEMKPCDAPTSMDTRPPSKPISEVPSHSSSSSASPSPSPTAVRRATFNCAPATTTHSTTSPVTRSQISRGSLSFSEVFRRREPPLLYLDQGTVAGSIGRHHHNFLSDDTVAPPSGSSSSSYLVMDNRSASWVS